MASYDSSIGDALERHGERETLAHSIERWFNQRDAAVADHETDRICITTSYALTLFAQASRGMCTAVTRRHASGVCGALLDQEGECPRADTHVNIAEG